MGAADDWASYDPGSLIAGRNMVADPFGDVAAAEAQQKAQEDALNQQVGLAQNAQDFFGQQSQAGIGYIQQGLAQGADALQGNAAGAEMALRNATDQAAGVYNQNFPTSMNWLTNGYNTGRGDMAAGYGQARSDLGTLQGLQGYGAGATSAINSYNALGGRQDRLGGMLDQRGGLYGGFEADPGYQFRKQQGEQAIMNQASAGGGRGSARTMEALSQFNQDLASQEYGNFASRRQAEAGIAGGSDAQYAALLQNQAGRNDAAALAAQQNQMGLAGMGYGAQNTLAGMSQQQGNQNAALSYGYGSQQAGMQGQYAQNLANLYGGQGSQLANLYGNVGSQLGSMYTNAGSNMGNVAIGVGGNAQQNANSLMGAYSNYANFGGMAQQAQANSNRETAGMMAAMFSDLRLKDDVELLHESPYERIGLRGYRWTWNEKANRLGYFGTAEGVIAQDVQRKHPHAVIDDDSIGFLLVNYDEIDRLIAEASRREAHA